MAKGRLFECAALYHPKPKKDGDGNEVEQKTEEIAGIPPRVLASSEQQAAMILARAIPESYVDKLDEVEVLIRPF